MSVLALVSAKGSPGVTTATLALAMAWPRWVLAAECDPAGGDFVAGYLQAQAPPSDGLLGLAMALRRNRLDDLDRHTVALDDGGDRLLLLGLRDPAQAASVAPLWPGLAEAFADLERADPPRDVLADAGRLDPALCTADLLGRADLVLLVLRPTLAAVAAAQPRVAALRRRLTDTPVGDDGLGLMLVGDAPYTAGEVAKALGAPVLASLPVDADAARVLAGEAAADRRFARSALLRAARTAAEQLHARVAEHRHTLAAPQVSAPVERPLLDAEAAR
jgi:hypothetical protein